MNTELPEGWINECRELFVQDMSGNRHNFKFSPSKVTTIEQQPHGGRWRAVAECQTCRCPIEPDWDSLRLHACKHIFLNIPFEAKSDIRA